MTRVRFRAGQVVCEVRFDDGPIAREVLEHLPISSTAHRWGNEVYFGVPVCRPNTQPTRQVAVGDVAYWPEGPCLCVFFGTTPASKADEPRPASPVTVIGHTETPAVLLRSIPEGATIVVELARGTHVCASRRGKH